MKLVTRVLAWPIGLWTIAQAAMGAAKWVRPEMSWWLVLWPTWLTVAYVVFAALVAMTFCCYCPPAFDDAFRAEEDEK